jgi:hypothetical protein
MMRELFERQVVKCRTVNQFNRLRIALENRITPLEFHHIAASIFERHASPASIQFVKVLGHQLRLSGKPVEPFTRTRIRNNTYLFSDNGSPAQKSLVICFPGLAGRLMMPVATFLQHLPARRADVILFNRHGDSLYANGIRGLANSFDDLLCEIDCIARAHPYRRIVTFGTSSGGLPALLSALYLDFDQAVMFCGSSLNTDRWRHFRDDERLKSAIARWSGRPRLLSVFGAECCDDRNSARELEEELPVELWPVPDESSHIVIQRFLYSGNLSGLLSMVLLEGGKGQWALAWRGLWRAHLSRPR